MIVMGRRLALAFALQCLTVSAFAADYPSKPIRLVVPYAPGGGADSVARIVARKVSENIGQPIVIENKGGAGSILGTDIVAKAEADGYTLLLGQSGPISINPAVYKSLPYDPVKDFAPVAMTTAYPYILVVNADLPVKSLQEFVALAKSKPGTMNYGSTGVGAANHLVSELFNAKAGLKMTHVPYRGTALAVGDLLGGQLTMVFGDPISVLSQMKAGKLRALRSPASNALPSRPRCRRSRRAATRASRRWPGTASSRRRKLRRDREEAQRGDRQGAGRSGDEEAARGSGDADGRQRPEAFAAFIQKDIVLWKAVATAANVTVE